MKNEYGLDNLNVRVHCPRCERIEKISVPFAPVNGKNFFFPHNGCDNCCGHEICERCRVLVSEILTAGYEYDGSPISLRIE